MKRPARRTKRRTWSTSRRDRRWARGVPVDPLAGGVPPLDIAAIVAGELAALAADAQTLATRLSPGDVVRAVVLSSNGLTDLLDIGGLRVAAELPPTLLPGQAITVAVTGLRGDRIDLQILSTTDAAGAPEAVLPQTGNGTAASQAVPAAPIRQAVAVSLLRQTAAVSPVGLPVSAGSAGQTVPGGSVRQAVPVAAHLGWGGPGQPVRSELQAIEARLATAHAMSPAAGAPPVVAPGAAQRVTGVAGQRAPLPASRGTARPPIEMRLPPPTPAGVAAGTTAVRAPAAPRGTAAFTEPAALLRALRLPVTAANLAAARMALDSPEKLPSALAALERALANDADPRVTTLSTLASFIARLDPRSPVLATQIEAYVDQVLDGSEGKIVQLLRAADGAAPEAERAGTGPGDPAEPALAEASSDAAAQERVAVLRAALDYDLKTQLFVLAALRPGSAAGAASATSSASDSAVAGVLTALTALQLHAAAVLSANPGGLIFSLPIALPDGIAQAHVRVDRDTPDGKPAPLDGDNFHIAFVLETRHLGTVGIDMMTVGRAVTLSVTALGELTERLEKLRYTVAKADAVVAPPPPLAAANSPSPQTRAGDPDRLVDVDA